MAKPQGPVEDESTEPKSHERMAGEGSIYKRTRTRADGTEYTRHIAQVSYGPRGARTYARRTLPTRAAAKKALAELLAPPPARSAQPLGDYLRSWLTDTAGPSLARNTRDAYAASIESLQAIHRIPIGELTPEDIDWAVNRLMAQRKGQGTAKPASPKTKRNAVAMLRRALKVAHERGHIDRNPAVLAMMPKVPRRSKAAMTPTLARRVLEVTAKDRYAAAYALAMCALRLGEVLGLARSDVDLAGAVVHVRYQLQGPGKAARRVQLKTTGSEAPVPLPTFAVERLRKHLERQDREMAEAGVEPGEDVLVFTTERGMPVNGTSLTHRFQDILEDARMDPLTIHEFRHGTATLLAAANVHPSVAQRYLRHTSSKMTLETYTHVTRAQERQAAEALDRLIGMRDTPGDTPGE